MITPNPDWSELDKEIASREEEEAKEEMKLKRLRELNNMSFMKRMQEPECVEELKNLELHQKQAWDNVMKRDKHSPEFAERFSEYWEDALKEKVKNMREWIANNK